MSYSGGWRPHIESALKLDIRRLARWGCIRNGAQGLLTWNDECGDVRASLRYSVNLQGDGGRLALRYTVPYRETDEPKHVTFEIRLSSIPLHYGGRRWYMHCPYTKQRAQTLHKWTGVDLFCHRTAIRPRPTYVSQRVSGCDRINAQRWAIRRKLKDSFSDLLCEPVKPMRMHWRTFQRYADRDAILAERDEALFLRRFGRFIQ